MACTVAATRAARSWQQKAASRQVSLSAMERRESAPLISQPVISETTGHGLDGRPTAVTADRYSGRHWAKLQASTLSGDKPLCPKAGLQGNSTPEEVTRWL